MSIEEQLVSEIKPYIVKGNLEELKEQWREYRVETEFDREVAWDYVFQKNIFTCSPKETKSNLRMA